jgi:outer membrane protein OmpA-like peptidoglycan-associated protein
MTASRRSKLKKNEQGSAVRPQLKSPRAHNVDSSRRPSTGPSNKLLEAGNTAVSQLLSGMSTGKALDQPVQAKMERAFGTDLSDVRVHNDASARAAAGEIDAEAFTQGDDIYLADGVSTETTDGKRLLAHELAHVVQQRRARGQQSSEISKPGDSFENEADQLAAEADAGRPVQVKTGGTTPAVQRQPAEKSLGEKAIDFLLEKGISWTDEGWKIGGIPIEKVPPALKTAANIMAKVLKGDLTGAVEIINPKDPEEERKAWEKVRRLKEEIDNLRPVEEREKERHEEKHREAEQRRKLPAEASKRLGLKPRDPKFELKVPELKLSEDLLGGPITHYLLDDFDVEKSQLKSKHRRRLNELADQVMSDPDAELDIVGHTDSTGPDSLNNKLSDDRANAVRDYLLKQGVRADKIKSVTGRAATDPFVAEATDADRSRNRRVEVFYKPGTVEKRKPRFRTSPLRLNR